jgi:endonuclease YncB( thermonuclease family)
LTASAAGTRAERPLPLILPEGGLHPLRGRVLLLGVLLWACPAPAAPDCPPPARGLTEKARLAYVIDGDTVILDKGERVRLIGIDAPELGHDGAANQPLATEATALLRDLAGHRGAPLGVEPGVEPRDRYGRRLAHLFDAEGHNLAEQLLRRGLAYLAPIPPNLRYLDCMQAAQAAARRARLGLWRAPALDAAHLPPREGFIRVLGEVERVRDGQGGLWIELKGGMALNVHAADLGAFRALRLDDLSGQEVEALGWVYRAKGEPRMRLRHPAALIGSPRSP